MKHLLRTCLQMPAYRNPYRRPIDIPKSEVLNMKVNEAEYPL